LQEVHADGAEVEEVEGGGMTLLGDEGDVRADEGVGFEGSIGGGL
jgi:hypothetical protein